MIAPETPVQALHVGKILVPVDFSAPSEKAFKYALSFARQFGSEIVLVHVLEPLMTSAATDASCSAQDRLVHAKEKLQALAETSPRSGNLYVTSTIRAGVPTHEIITAAKEFDVDLIITATHGLAGCKHFGLGRTADRVARAAPCPVLVVRPQEHEFADIT